MHTHKSLLINVLKKFVITCLLTGHKFLSGFDKSRTCLGDVLEIMDCRTWFFITSTLTNIPYRLLSTRGNFKKLGVHVRFLKPTMWCFSFHVDVLHFSIKSLIIVSKNNVQWSCLPDFSYLLLMEKLKRKHLDGVFSMLWC